MKDFFDFFWPLQTGFGFKGIVSYEEDIFTKACSLNQGFVSGSGLAPDSIKSVDPDPYSESGSGSRRANMNHKSTKN
jgi:hypothetical protein